MSQPLGTNPTKDAIEAIQAPVAKTLADAVMPESIRHRPWRHGWQVWLATGFWVGFFPVAPGTVGTLWGLPLAWALAYLPPAAHGAILLALAAAGVPLCTVAASRLKLKDPGCIVYDEFVSLAIAYFLVPLTPATVIVGFLFHRLLDILKPPPIRQLERLHAGLGIMADDLAAGLITNIILHFLVWAGPEIMVGG